MKLEEFYSKFYTVPNGKDHTKVYVFDSTDSADSWIRRKYYGAGINDHELIMILESDYEISFFVKSEWCEAEIVRFFAVEQDVIVVVVKKE